MCYCLCCWCVVLLVLKSQCTCIKVTMCLCCWYVVLLVLWQASRMVRLLECQLETKKFLLHSEWVENLLFLSLFFNILSLMYRTTVTTECIILSQSVDFAHFCNVLCSQLSLANPHWLAVMCYYHRRRWRRVERSDVTVQTSTLTSWSVCLKLYSVELSAFPASQNTYSSMSVSALALSAYSVSIDYVGLK